METNIHQWEHFEEGVVDAVDQRSVDSRKKDSWILDEDLDWFP